MSVAVRIKRNIDTSPQPYEFENVDFYDYEVRDVRVFDGMYSITKKLGTGKNKNIDFTGFGYVEVDFKVHNNDTVLKLTLLRLLNGTAGRLYIFPKFIHAPALSKTVILPKGQVPDDAIIAGYGSHGNIITVRFNEIDKEGIELDDGNESTTSRGHYDRVVTYVDQIAPQVYYYEGDYKRTYFVWMQLGGVGYSNEPMVFYYDHDSEAVSSHVGVGPGRVDVTDDAHCHGSIIVADDGRIIVAHEKSNALGEHNSPFLIKKSDTAEDNSAWTQMAELDDYLAYPTLHKDQDSNLFLLGRYGQSSSDHYRCKLFKSTDHGATWDAGTVILTLYDVSYNNWFYPRRLIQRDDIIRLPFSRYIYTTGIPASYYIESLDGNIWYNIDHSWAKKVSVDGALTLTELNTNCLIECASSTASMRRLYCGCVSPNGNVYLIQSDGSWSGSPPFTTWHLRYYENDTWKKTSIDSSIIPGDDWYESWIHAIYAYSDTVMDIWLTFEATKREIRRYRTLDRGLSWTKIEDVTTGSTYDHKFIAVTQNAPDCVFWSLMSSYLNNGVISADITYQVKLR